MLTVRVAPLTDAREKTTVRWSRALEDKLMGRWTRKGLTAPKQAMLQAGVPVSFVKSPGIW